MSFIAQSGDLTPPPWGSSSPPFTPSSTTAVTPAPSAMTSNFQTNTSSGLGVKVGSGTPINELLIPTSFPVPSTTIQPTSGPTRVGITPPPTSGPIQSSPFSTSPTEPPTVPDQQGLSTASSPWTSTQLFIPSSLSASINETATSPISRPPTPLTVATTTLPTVQSSSEISTSFQTSPISVRQTPPYISTPGLPAATFETTSSAVFIKGTPGLTTTLQQFGNNGRSTPAPGSSFRPTPTPDFISSTTINAQTDSTTTEPLANVTSVSAAASPFETTGGTPSSTESITHSTVNTFLVDNSSNVFVTYTVESKQAGSPDTAQDYTVGGDWTGSWSDGGGITATTANGTTHIGWIVASPFAIPLVIFAIVLGIIVVIALLAALLWCIYSKCCSAPRAAKYPLYPSKKKKSHIIDDLKLPPFILARLLEDEQLRPLLVRDDIAFYKQQQHAYDNKGFQDKLPSVVAQFGKNEPQYKTVVKVPWPLDYNSANQLVPTYPANKSQPNSNSILRPKKPQKGSSIDDDPFDVNYPFANYPANRFSSRPSYAYSNYATNPLYHSDAKTPLFGLTGKERAKMYPRLSGFSPLSVSQMLLPTYSAAQRPAAVKADAGYSGLDQPDGGGRGKKKVGQDVGEKKHTTVVHIGSAGKTSGLVTRNVMRSDAASAALNSAKPGAVPTSDHDEFRSIVELE